MTDLTKRDAEFLLYQAEDGRTRIEVRFDGETACPGCRSDRWPSCSNATSRSSRGTSRTCSTRES